MTATERPVVIDCDGERMIGIVHQPAIANSRGVLILVGGPQYRIGSHRQFLLLARYLAERGTPVLRFDYRGMGDSDGELRSFEFIDSDIRAAIDEIFSRMPQLGEIVIWGLCDAASAALMYADSDSRVTGLVLLNPWVRSEATLAKTHLKHYYTSKLIDRQFWLRLLSGRANLRSVIFGFVDSIRTALGFHASGPDKSNEATKKPFTERMLEGFGRFNGPTLIILSGDDLTAAEFKDEIDRSTRWRALMQRRGIEQIEIPGANHTFARREWRDRVATSTYEWVSGW